MRFVAPTNYLIASSLGLMALIALLFVVGSSIGGSFERTVIVFLVSLTAIASIGIYSGNSGVLSFGHLSFMAVGAYASALLTLPVSLKSTTLPALPHWLATTELGILPATIIAVGVSMVFAIFVGLAIWRLEGSSATIATLALLIITHGVLIGSRDITRGAQTFFGVPRETTLGVAAVGCFIALVIARYYRDSASGLRLRAGRENEIAASAIGVNVRRERFVAFVLSAAIMGMAGALVAHSLGAFSPKRFFFTDTFFLLAMLIVGGISTVTGAISGAVVVTLVTEILRRLESGVDLGFLTLPQIFGTTQIGIALLILIALVRRPDGIAGLLEWEERLFRPRRKKVEASNLVAQESAPIVATNLTKRFGGVVAVDDVDVTVNANEILGLIGPNGSGKTTLLNQLSGILRPSSGTIVRGTHDLTHLPIHKFADLGIARTFQNIRLFSHLTVYQNIQSAAIASHDAQQADERVLSAITWMKLENIQDLEAGNLSYGDQRRVEIARALVSQPSLLFLDEPAAGMNREETDALLETLRQINTELGIGILIVDHDLALINALCDRLVVLSEGKLIAEGTPDEIRENQHVIDAYIGASTAA